MFRFCPNEKLLVRSDVVGKQISAGSNRNSLRVDFRIFMSFFQFVLGTVFLTDRVNAGGYR